MQICSHEGNYVLIPLANIYAFPEELKSILRNSRIIKAGIETRKDAQFLSEDYGLSVVATFDLRYLAQDTGHQPLGLEYLAKTILNIELGKDWDVVSSNWEQEPLDSNQLLYAEKAVKASIDIFKTLIPYAVNKVTKNSILIYCYENLDKPFIFYSNKTY